MKEIWSIIHTSLTQLRVTYHCHKQQLAISITALGSYTGMCFPGKQPASYVANSQLEILLNFIPLIHLWKFCMCVNSYNCMDWGMDNYSQLISSHQYILLFYIAAYIANYGYCSYSCSTYVMIANDATTVQHKTLTVEKSDEI